MRSPFDIRESQQMAAPKPPSVSSPKVIPALPIGRPPIFFVTLRHSPVRRRFYDYLPDLHRRSQGDFDFHHPEELRIALVSLTLHSGSTAPQYAQNWGIVRGSISSWRT